MNLKTISNLLGTKDKSLQNYFEEYVYKIFNIEY